MAFKIKGVEIIVKKGSIVDLNVDAVVNAANSYLLMGGGVAGALKRFGGSIIEDEAVKHAPLPIGEAVATTAGRLRAKYVIHAPTMENPGLTTSSNVYRAVKGALLCAEVVGSRIVAFPGMGTGVGGVPFGDAADAMVSAILEHISAGTALKMIVLVDLDERMVEAFLEALKKGVP